MTTLIDRIRSSLLEPFDLSDVLLQLRLTEKDVYADLDYGRPESEEPAPPNAPVPPQKGAS